jgi:hypothetical protein
MRYLPGQPTDISNESISSRNLLDAAVVNADFLPTIFQLWQGRETPLSSMLSMKGMTTKGLFDGFSGKSMRVVKSNHVQYAIKNSDKRKLRFRADSTGKTFSCAAYPTEPGKNQSIIIGHFDSNWAGHKEVIVLDDGRTHLYVINTTIPVEEDGVFKYEMKLVTGNKDEYVNLDCLLENAEAAPTMTMYEHDWSETATEKYTFDGWGHAYMTLQRMKYSYSGTAEAMKADTMWTTHNGEATFLTYAQNQMMKRAAEYHEYALINGKGTVTIDGDVLMKDKQGREIMAGDGVLNQNEGAYEYPYNNLTLGFLENIMEDADIRADRDGKLELGFFSSRRTHNQFSKMMADNGFVTKDNNVEGSGAEKGVNNTYSYYELGGVRIIPRVYHWLDDVARPTKWLDDGTRLGQWDGFFVPMGETEGGEPQVQLVQLRPMKSGSVDGINVGGKMATSVDGSHHHILFQTGVITRTKIMRIFRPYKRSVVSM